MYDNLVDVSPWCTNNCLTGQLLYLQTSFCCLQLLNSHSFHDLQTTPPPKNTTAEEDDVPLMGPATTAINNPLLEEEALLDEGEEAAAVAMEA